MDNFSFNGTQFSRSEILQLLLRVSLASVITYYSIKWMMSQLDPTTKNKRKAKLRAEEQMKRLCEQGGFTVSTQHFSDYEWIIATHLVVPADININWSDIAGLDEVIQELRESVVLPVKHKDIFNQSKLCQAPKGVLLHGPPGCGKTLIAKATAKEAGMRFINLDVAILTDKWYGESQKLASAVFSLAMKIQPCIIFIDEIDSFLRSRNSSDHEATAMMKAQFMMLWDGLCTNPKSTVIVMGATNRPRDLDYAILRRMPAQFHIGLPSETQRLQILKLILETERVHHDVDFDRLSQITNGFSGSDLREMCRNASIYRMRLLMRCIDNQLTESESQPSTSSECYAQNTLAAISMEDLVRSFEQMKKSKMYTDVMYTDNWIRG